MKVTFLVVGEIDLKKLERLGINLIKIDKLDQIENIKNLDSIVWIISRWAHYKYDSSFLSKFPNLKYVYLLQIWTDNVDFQYCKSKWIEVKNFVSFKSVESVAELTVWMLIMWIRQWFNLGCKLKNWIYTRQPLGKNLFWVKVGVLGFWRIGKKVASYLQVFWVKVSVYDIIFKNFSKEKFEDVQEQFNVKVFDDLNKFLEEVDYITVHIPRQWNENLLNYNNLKNIRWIVNVARAGIVNEEDVLKLLDEWKMEFYVSDVACGEPDITKINDKLIKHKRVFMTPHIGANTEQVQDDILEKLIEEINNKELL